MPASKSGAKKGAAKKSTERNKGQRGEEASEGKRQGQGPDQPEQPQEPPTGVVNPPGKGAPPLQPGERPVSEVDGSVGQPYQPDQVGQPNQQPPSWQPSQEQERAGAPLIGQPAQTGYAATAQPVQQAVQGDGTGVAAAQNAQPTPIPANAQPLITPAPQGTPFVSQQRFQMLVEAVDRLIAQIEGTGVLPIEPQIRQMLTQARNLA